MTAEAVPPMFDFYTRFYDAVAGSAANAEYCARVYGRNLCQHGFADLAHLDHLIRASGMGAGSRVLDLGCGSGMISEYFSDQTGAHVTGIDFIPRPSRTRWRAHGISADRLISGSWISPIWISGLPALT